LSRNSRREFDYVCCATQKRTLEALWQEAQLHRIRGFFADDKRRGFLLRELHFPLATQLLEFNGYAADAYKSALSATMVLLVPIVGLMLPLYVTLTGGDLVAKEIEDGTMRMILSRPVSRVRLLVTKWLAGLVFSAVLVFLLASLGLLCGRLWFPWKGLFIWSPDDEIFSLLEPSKGLVRYSISMAILLIPAFTVMGVAFMFSCFNIKPAAATILALSVIFIDFVVCHIPFFQDYENCFLTTHLRSYVWVFYYNIPWWKISESLSILVGLNLTFLTIGCAAFHVRDIKS
jgi:ABC-2 type transport system permease protein